jgi:hypothetical protein
LFYRQISTASHLDVLPPEAVVFFEGFAAVKDDSGKWLLTGEKTPVDSRTLGSMSTVFHVISEFSYFPATGYNEHRVNLTQVMNFVSKYDELPSIVVFEWTRDFFGVSLDTARNGVWQLVKIGKLQPTEAGTLKLKQ